MNQSTLKWLRLITPGIIILVFSLLLGNATGLWTFALPSSIAELKKSLIIIVIGGIYYMLPIRKWFNKKYFNEVTENLRSGLVQISGLRDDQDALSWRSIRGIFFHLVDNDKSLSIKSNQAYFNGYVWTTIADIRAFSLLFSIFSIFIAAIFQVSGYFSAALFFTIFLLSFAGSKAVTKRHMEIGDEQLEIIEYFYKDSLKEKMENAAKRISK